MVRIKKNAVEVTKPQQNISPSQPLNSRPRRSTKDAFYDKLSTLTATKPVKEEEEEEEIEEKPKVVRKKAAVTRKASIPTSSSAGTSSIPVLVKPKEEEEVVTVAVPSNAAPQKSNALHHFVPELREPKVTLHKIKAQPLQIDPRMQHCCSLCSRRFQHVEELQEHLTLHVEDFTHCSLCEKPPTPFTLEEYISHLGSHFIIEYGQTTCIFCNENINARTDEHRAQHLLFYCKSIRYCFLCDAEIDEDKAHKHRKEKHGKLLNRYVCCSCFLGFPSLAPFLSHICEMRYRCMCELTDVYRDHVEINEHIDGCEESELQYHGVLVPDSTTLRKRQYFVNLHSIQPEHNIDPTSSYGFLHHRVTTKDVPELAEARVKSRRKPRARVPIRNIMAYNAAISSAGSFGAYINNEMHDINGINPPLFAPKNEFGFNNRMPLFTGKPIYRPRHRSMLAPPLMNQQQQQQQQQFPRVVCPRAPRIRLLNPMMPTLTPEVKVETFEKNDFSNAKRKSEEENLSTLPTKRIRDEEMNCQN